MSQFITGAVDETEPQFRQHLASLYAGEGVLSGLAVTQTATASGSVLVAAGIAIDKGSTLEGAWPMHSDAQETVDVLGANPMGSLPRNDLIVFDSATVSGGTGGIKVIVGTPNASPTDPTVPATAVVLARIRNIGSATVVRDTGIDDLRTITSLTGPTAQQFSPSVTGISGTALGYYEQIGGWVFYRVEFTASGSSTGSIGFTLPVPSIVLPAGSRKLGEFDARDVSAGQYWAGTVRALPASDAAATAVALYFPAATNNVAQTTTSPFTWASGDTFSVAGHYPVSVG